MGPAAKSPTTVLGAAAAPLWRRPHAVLLGLVALTAVLEAAIWLRSPVIAPDGIHFIAIAHDLGRDPLAAMRTHDQHPAYPALICAVRETVFFWSHAETTWIPAARLASAACGVAGVIVVWLLARRIASAAVANLSALLYAFLPVLRQNSVDALSDTPHLLLYLASALLVAYAVGRRSLLLFGLAGMASGLAFLVRPEGLSVAFVAAAMAVALPSWRRELGWHRALGASAALVIGAGLFVAPYVIASGRLSGKITAKIAMVSAPASLATTAVDHTDDRSALQAAPVPQDLRLTPIVVAGPITHMSWPRALGKAFVIFGQRLGECLRWILLLPLAMGLLAALQFGDRPTRCFLWALALFHVALLLLLYCVGGYIECRHALPLVALLLPTIAAGLVALHQSAARVPLVRRHPRLAAGCGLAVLVLLIAPRTLRPLHETHQHTLAAARVLDELASRGDTVLSNSRHVIYYTSLRGKLAGGVRLYNGMPELGPVQPGGHRFVALELGGEQFHEAWREELAAAYTPVATIPSNARLDQNEIMIFERRTSIAHASGAAELR